MADPRMSLEINLHNQADRYEGMSDPFSSIYHAVRLRRDQADLL
jgi:hypothetical protein